MDNMKITLRKQLHLQYYQKNNIFSNKFNKIKQNRIWVLDITERYRRFKQRKM